MFDAIGQLVEKESSNGKRYPARQLAVGDSLSCFGNPEAAWFRRTQPAVYA